MSVHRLAEKLRDPFEMFPLEDALRSLQAAIDESREHYLSEAMREAPRRTVPQEHAEEVITLLLGTALLAAQRAIAQVAALLTSENIPGGPQSKQEAYRFAALPTKIAPDLTETEALNVAANYFKHSDEWPVDWDLQRAERGQRRTIEHAVALGMRADSERNLQTAYESLGLHPERGLDGLSGLVSEWRRRVAEQLQPTQGHEDP